MKEILDGLDNNMRNSESTLAKMKSKRESTYADYMDLIKLERDYLHLLRTLKLEYENAAKQILCYRLACMEFSAYLCQSIIYKKSFIWQMNSDDDDNSQMFKVDHSEAYSVSAKATKRKEEDYDKKL